MKTVTITRTQTSQEGTFGILSTQGFTCYTGELPWANNQHDISCIPSGTYLAKWAISPSKGLCYHIQNVLNRDNVLIHSGNFCGSLKDGYHSDFLGCIGLGKGIGILNKQQAITQSKIAVNEFQDFMQQQDFTLTIVWKDGVGI